MLNAEPVEEEESTTSSQVFDLTYERAIRDLKAGRWTSLGSLTKRGTEEELDIWSSSIHHLMQQPPVRSRGRHKVSRVSEE